MWLLFESKIWFFLLYFVQFYTHLPAPLARNINSVWQFNHLIRLKSIFSGTHRDKLANQKTMVSGENWKCINLKMNPDRTEQDRLQKGLTGDGDGRREIGKTHTIHKHCCVCEFALPRHCQVAILMSIWHFV